MAGTRTKINGEPVKLVESFDELREGVVVYTGRCLDHGRFHRAILVGKITGWVSGGAIDRSSGVMTTFSMVPFPHDPNDVITPGFVAAGQVYRVIDGLEPTETTTRARKKDRADGR